MRCPHCGEEIQTRAGFGEGTQKGKTSPINENRLLILKIIGNRRLTVDSVFKVIQAQNHPRISKRKTKWNHHTVQADLSLLVGGGWLDMKTKGEPAFDPSSGEWVVEKRPSYGQTRKWVEAYKKGLYPKKKATAQKPVEIKNTNSDWKEVFKQ